MGPKNGHTPSYESLQEFMPQTCHFLAPIEVQKPPRAQLYHSMQLLLGLPASFWDLVPALDFGHQIPKQGY